MALMHIFVHCCINLTTREHERSERLNVLSHINLELETGLGLGLGLTLEKY